MAEERRAIRTDDFLIAPHVEENVRMIEGRNGSDALELPGADLDDGHSGRIVKMRNDVIRHAAIRCTLSLSSLIIPKERRRDILHGASLYSIIDSLPGNCQRNEAYFPVIAPVFSFWGSAGRRPTTISSLP